MSGAKLITISMDEYKRLEAAAARVAKLEAALERCDAALTLIWLTGPESVGNEENPIRAAWSNARAALEGRDDIPRSG